MTPSWAGAYPFFRRRIKVGDHEMNVVDEGPADAPVVLCLHGNPTWSFYWRRLVSELSSDHRVIAIDHLGCGLSDKPATGPYRLGDHVARAEAVVDALEVDRFTLAVHDWGGAIGMGLAARAPERVVAAIVTNTAAFPSKTMPWRIAVCRLPGLGAVGVRGLNGFALAATRMAVAHPLDESARAGLLAPYGSWADRVAIHRFVEDIPMTPDHPSWSALCDAERGVESLRRKPVLLAWGMQDWCFTPAYLDEWRQRLPDAEVLEVPDASHYLLEDAPDIVLAAARRFVDRARVAVA